MASTCMAVSKLLHAFAVIIVEMVRIPAIMLSIGRSHTSALLTQAGWGGCLAAAATAAAALLLLSLPSTSPPPLLPPPPPPEPAESLWPPPAWLRQEPERRIGPGVSGSRKSITGAARTRRASCNISGYFVKIPVPDEVACDDNVRGTDVKALKKGLFVHAWNSAHLQRRAAPAVLESGVRPAHLHQQLHLSASITSQTQLTDRSRRVVTEQQKVSEWKDLINQPCEASVRLPQHPQPAAWAQAVLSAASPPGGCPPLQQCGARCVYRSRRHPQRRRPSAGDSAAADRPRKPPCTAATPALHPTTPACIASDSCQAPCQDDMFSLSKSAFSRRFSCGRSPSKTAVHRCNASATPDAPKRMHAHLNAQVLLREMELIFGRHEGLQPASGIAKTVNRSRGTFCG